jgi:hypothetical protein
MTTLVRDIERPSFLDRPTEGQLSFGASAPVREAPVAEPGRVPLSERLRAERAEAQAGGSAVQTETTRGGGATLDEMLVGAWEGLSVRRPVACPVCAGPMHPRRDAAGGACGDCGSQLR